MNTRESNKSGADTAPPLTKTDATTSSAFSLFADHYQQVAIGTLAEYLPNTSISALTKTSHLFHGTFKPLLDERRTACVDYIISLIVNSNQDAVKDIIRTRPSLLRYPGSTHVTAFQKAIMLKDGMMWQMLSAYFDNLRDGDEERRRQFYDILPSGHFQDRPPHCFDHLIQLISSAKPEDLAAVIALQPDSNPLSLGLAHFRRQFDSLIAKERDFNPQHLIAAENAYNKSAANSAANSRYDFKQKDNIALDSQWSKDQKTVFCVFVIGYIQSRLPLNHLQAFCSEFYKNDDGTQFNGGIEFHRSLICRFSLCEQAPLISKEPKGLGYEYMINSCQANFIQFEGIRECEYPYARFIKSLTSALQALKASIDKPLKEAQLQKKHTQSPHCAIM